MMFIYCLLLRSANEKSRKICEVFSSSQSSEKENDKRNNSKGEEIRVKDFEETKLLDFYNVGGI
jgi:hypothetical protein